MKQRKKILCFFGTRPEAIKMAPVVQELKREKNFKVIVVVSAQHRGMLDQVLKLFKITADEDLNLMKSGQSLFDITVDVLRKFEPVLDRIKPDLVLVHGDTTTTMGGSLAGFYKKIPVGHVEAGLRTRDKYHPFPEEINRRVTDSITTLYFAPTKESRTHLLKESLPEKDIFVTGNTVIDALLAVARKTIPLQSPALRHALKTIGRKPFVLMTAHRRENFGAPFRQICQAVLELSRKFPDLHWIYPVHPNPNIIKPAHELMARVGNIHLITPVDYGDLVSVMKRCRIVVTDSGGLQEEAPSLGKPVLVLRNVTERPEAVRAGTVKLVGTDKDLIVKSVSRLMTEARFYSRMANAVNPYGDGQAARRIVEALRWYFGLSRRRPEPFRSSR